MIVYLGRSKSSDVDNTSQCSSMYHHERACSSQSGEEGSSGKAIKQPLSPYGLAMASHLVGLPEASHLGWGAIVSHSEILKVPQIASLQAMLLGKVVLGLFIREDWSMGQR